MLQYHYAVATISLCIVSEANAHMLASLRSLFLALTVHLF